jgi:hypothetical protein
VNTVSTAESHNRWYMRFLQDEAKESRNFVAQKMALKIFSVKLRGGTSGASVSSTEGIPYFCKIKHVNFNVTESPIITYSDKVHIARTPEW